MFYSVDSIHGGLVSLLGDDGQQIEVPVSLLPENTLLGAVVTQTLGSFVTAEQDWQHGEFEPAAEDIAQESFELATEETQQRQQHVAGLLNKILPADDDKKDE